MPWVKSFDENAALTNAMNLFWQKGYTGTSISDLLASTGLNKGSFYNAFGDKQSLFQRALGKYDQDIRAALLARLEAMDQPRDAILQFFEQTLAHTLNDTQCRGCFLINTSLDMENQPQSVQDTVIKGLAEIEAFFRRCIEVGQVRQSISDQLDAKHTAKVLLALAIAIRVLAVVHIRHPHCAPWQRKQNNWFQAPRVN